MNFAHFFDAVKAYESGAARGDSSGQARLTELANALVDHMLVKFDRIEGYERDFAPELIDEKEDESALAVLHSIWRVYEDWAEEAEPLYERIERMPSARHSVRELDELSKRIGSARARLTVRPEEVLEGHRQARRGETVALEVMRNELRARHGA